MPLGGHLLRLSPELDRSATSDVADTEPRLIPAAKRKWLSRNGNADVDADHSGRRMLHDISGHAATLREYRGRVAVWRRVFDLHRLRDIRCPDDHHHRTEDLLLRDAHVGRYMIDQRRTEEVATLLAGHRHATAIH